MNKLLKKEFILGVHPMCYLFVCFGLMFFIPSYPYIMVFFYALIIDFFLAPLALQNRDIDFTIVLPVRKKDIVMAKISVNIILQMITVVLAIPCALLTKNNNSVGLDANFTLFGVGFIMFAMHNLVYFPLYFKKPHKFLGSSFLAIIVASIVGIVFTVISTNNNFSFIKNFDGFELDSIVYRLAFLLISVGIYIGSLFISTKLSIRNFEKLNL